MSEIPAPYEYGEDRATPDQLREIDVLFGIINYSRRRMPMNPNNPLAGVRLWKGVDAKGRIRTTSLEFVPCRDTSGGTLSALGVVRRADERIVEMYLSDSEQVVHWKSNDDIRSGYGPAERMIRHMGEILDAMDTHPDLVEVDGHMGSSQSS